MRKKIIAGNWKMNLDINESKQLIENIKNSEFDKDKEVIIFPPYVFLQLAEEELKDTDIRLGAQNLCQYDDGAYTGEVSAKMLKALGVDSVLVGHSERRTIFSENDQVINTKVKQGLENGLRVVLCLGESEDIREEAKHEDFVREQILKGLDKIEAKIGQLIIAYEPIWAIGTGKTCDPKDAEKMCKFIRDQLASLYGQEFAEKTRILYGGSVKPENAKELLEKENIDGALVGGASLDSKKFLDIINYEV
ncbi:triose-phosphate isomerase [Peptoniphilus obesi]|uniref:triose-phosphate isomerase n=1 Tax=Peptoniphilus obesi TaxID=1472765 RepID=UPI0004AE7235|nr:triose-phosphate isomerase [Peptoniphilus obesi]